MTSILFITTSFEDGAIPNILLDLAPLWRSWGWDCTFLALEPLPEHHASVQRCRQLGFRLLSLNVGPRSVIRALFRLRRVIRDLAPDLISTHLGRADIFTPWVKGKVPMITTHHNVRSHHGFLTNFGYKISDSLVAVRTGVSQACNDSFLLDGFLTTPHSVISNPVDPNRLVVGHSRQELLRSWGWDEPVQLLVAVARLSQQKGQPDLLEAFRRLKASGRTTLRLAIAGEGPLRAELEQLITDKGLSHEVRLLGRYPAVADLYAAADGFILPSLWEGLGLVILEAWCLGCPVAASDLPAVQEFVVDGENGALFRAGDPNAIAEGIVRLLDDPNRGRLWASRGRQLVLERFSPVRIAKQYSDLFHKVLTSVPKP